LSIFIAKKIFREEGGNREPRRTDPREESVEDSMAIPMSGAGRHATAGREARGGGRGAEGHHRAATGVRGAGDGLHPAPADRPLESALPPYVPNRVKHCCGNAKRHQKNIIMRDLSNP